MKSKPNIRFNSPVVLTFSLLCLFALILNHLTSGVSNHLFFSVYRSSLLDPLTYIRVFGHVLGHADSSHFLGNIMLILIIGPLLEEKYGPLNLLFVIVSTALITGVVHMVIFPHVYLLGASGVVFAFILLSSFTSVKDGAIPLTFILVAILYLGQELLSIFLIKDNISNLTHILGGLIGAWLGYVMNTYAVKRY